MKEAVFIYPGTFDPFTLGHKDIAMRAAALCSKLIVAVSEDARKECMFSIDERVNFAAAALKGSNIKVVPFEGLLTDFARSCGARCIIRGVRTNGDFEAESILALNYKTLAPEIENLLLLTERRLSHISGRIVRDLIRFGGTLEGYVDPEVKKLLLQMK